MIGSLGLGEIVLVAVVALIVIGPDKLPDVARSVGKGLAEFRKVTNELRWQLMSTVEEPSKRRPPPRTPRVTKPEGAPPSAVVRPVEGAEIALTSPDAEADAPMPIERNVTPSRGAMTGPPMSAALMSDAPISDAPNSDAPTSPSASPQATAPAAQSTAPAPVVAPAETIAQAAPADAQGEAPPRPAPHGEGE